MGQDVRALKRVREVERSAGGRGQCPRSQEAKVLSPRRTRVRPCGSLAS